MAIERGQVYKCGVCGNMVEVLYVGGGQLVCCGQPMDLVVPKREEEVGKEKHVPVIEKTAKGILVKIGSIPHPMEEKHFIEWIVVEADNNVYRQFLKPGDPPQAEFPVRDTVISVREYCNVHGLWLTER